MTSRRLCAVADLEVGQLRAVELDGRSVVVVRTAQGFHALRNRCPHQGAPLDAGTLSGTFLPSPVGVYEYGREGQILTCPWHRWEFDVTTGRSLHAPATARVASYDVRVEGDDVVLCAAPTARDGR